MFHTETKTEADGQVFWQRLELPGLDGLGHHFGAEKGPNILPFCNSTLSSSNMGVPSIIHSVDLDFLDGVGLVVSLERFHADGEVAPLI